MLEIDNKKTVDLANHWSVGGQTKHIDVKQYLLWELKEEGLLQIKHDPGCVDFLQRIFQCLQLRSMYKCTLKLMGMVNKIMF